jgi:hypothetical protein
MTDYLLIKDPGVGFGFGSWYSYLISGIPPVLNRKNIFSVSLGEYTFFAKFALFFSNASQ